MLEITSESYLTTSVNQDADKPSISSHELTKLPLVACFSYLVLHLIYFSFDEDSNFPPKIRCLTHGAKSYLLSLDLDKLATKLMKIAKTGFDSSKTRSFKHPRNLCMKTAPLI